MIKDENSKVNIDELLETIPNRFVLSLAVAKRARQIKDGAKPLISYDAVSLEDPIQIALKEIYLGRTKVAIVADRDEEVEMIEEIDRYLDEKTVAAEEADLEGKKSKKDVKVKSKSKSLSA